MRSGSAGSEAIWSCGAAPEPGPERGAPQVGAAWGGAGVPVAVGAAVAVGKRGPPRSVGTAWRMVAAPSPALWGLEAVKGRGGKNDLGGVGRGEKLGGRLASGWGGRGWRGGGGRGLPVGGMRSPERSGAARGARSCPPRGDAASPPSGAAFLGVFSTLPGSHGSSEPLPLTYGRSASRCVVLGPHTRFPDTSGWGAGFHQGTACAPPPSHVAIHPHMARSCRRARGLSPTCHPAPRATGSPGLVALHQEPPAVVAAGPARGNAPGQLWDAAGGFNTCLPAPPEQIGRLSRSAGSSAWSPCRPPHPCGSTRVSF